MALRLVLPQVLVPTLCSLMLLFFFVLSLFFSLFDVGYHDILSEPGFFFVRSLWRDVLLSVSVLTSIFVSSCCCVGVGPSSDEISSSMLSCFIDRPFSDFLGFCCFRGDLGFFFCLGSFAAEGFYGLFSSGFAFSASLRAAIFFQRVFVSCLFLFWAG